MEQSPISANFEIFLEILFQDCKSNCFDFEFAAPTTDDDIKCVKNCLGKDLCRL